MKNILLEKHAIEDLDFWSKSDPKLLKKIAQLLLAISKDPFSGIGKPEALRGQLKDYWSRRINDEHRMVYTIRQNEIVVISCRSHYDF